MALLEEIFDQNLAQEAICAGDQSPHIESPIKLALGPVSKWNANARGKKSGERLFFPLKLC
jgi:hypothetical protein